MWNKRLYRPLLWALLLSLLAHIVLIGRLPWFEWEKSIDIPILVELTPIPMKAVPVKTTDRFSSEPPSQVKSEPVKPIPPQPVELPAPEVAPLPALAPPVPDPPVAEVPLAEKPVQENETPAPAATLPVEEEIMAALPEEPVPSLPSHVEIEYRILRKGGVAGVERHSYLVGEDGRYSLTSTAQPKGLLALALSDLLQKSEGKVTAQGLKPETFLYQYGKNSDKAQKASFDWESGKLLLETGSRRQEVELTEGTQDLMSFMYQFMFVPPLQEMQLAITNGKRLKTYAYGFDGEETLDTAFGKVRCLHIARSSGDGEEKTDLWLAADYHYLPIKLSKTEKDGTVLERIATRLQVE
jgi:hypothetical protein